MGEVEISIHGWSRDCQSNSSVRRYSDMDRSAYSRIVRDCQSNSGLQSGGQTRHGTTGHELNLKGWKKSEIKGSW